MNKNDLRIISQLRNNARMSLTKLSKKTSIPVSTIFDRLKFHENNIIRKHTTLIDFSKLGFHTRATLNLKVAREDKEALMNHLVKHQSINSVFRINNGFDFMVEGVFHHIKDAEGFIEQLNDKFVIEDSRIHYIVEDIKREAFMTDIVLMDLTSRV